MKVSYVSDLHLDFYVGHDSNSIKWEKRTCEYVTKLINTDKGEKKVLCLAGDMSHYNQQSLWAIKVFAAHYEQVFVQVGNHDYYLISGSQEKKYVFNSQNRVDALYEAIKSIPNVQTFFYGETYIFNGYKFGGTPLWYSLDTFEQKTFFSNNSNDSVFIKGVSIPKEHLINQYEYQYLLHQDLDVMISHFPVIEIDSHKKYGSTTCYLTPVKELAAPAWIFGHAHEQKTYVKSYGTFYINSMGYPQENLSKSINSFQLNK